MAVMKVKKWIKDNGSIFTETDLRFLIKTTLPSYLSLVTESDCDLSDQKLKYLADVKRLYQEGMPLAYILGREDFFGWEFKVDNRTLIPRKETELIVEKAIDIIKKGNLTYILDLCCGCANIAISIKKSVSKGLAVFSSDISLEALGVSKENLKNHGADIKLINADLLSGFKYKIFDLIISNPPYVENEFIKGSLEYEPRLALEGGVDGLFFINKILSQVHLYLKENGYFIFEMGYNHKECVDKFIRNTGKYEIIEWIRDYSGHCRGIILKKSRG
jgi:release factor glutamine methyltransferase